MEKQFSFFGYTRKDIAHIIYYSLSMAALVLLLKWLQWKYLITDNSFDVYAALIAVFFTLLGIWVATQLTRTKMKTVVIEKQVVVTKPEDFAPDEAELEKMNLTSREREVLELLVRGYTNAEIAEKLFLSLSTVKTHVSNLFVKMEVKNRVQAVEKANRLRICRVIR